MAYTVVDYPSKKAARAAIAASPRHSCSGMNALFSVEAQALALAECPWNHHYERVGIPVYQPGPFGPDVKDGAHAFEGPHYPKPHRWYGSGMVKGGMLLELK